MWIFKSVNHCWSTGKQRHISVLLSLLIIINLCTPSGWEAMYSPLDCLPICNGDIARAFLPPNIALFVIHILKRFYNTFSVSTTFKVGRRPSWSRLKFETVFHFTFPRLTPKTPSRINGRSSKSFQGLVYST